MKINNLNNNNIIKQCQFDKKNLCQSKLSAGHFNTIFSIDKKYCAKQLTNKKSLEYLFLKENQINFKSFIPKLIGTCLYNNKEYVIIENLKYNFKNPIEIDIKIGNKTVSKKILKIKNKKMKSLKLLKHKLLDKHLSTSNKFFFRVEGMNSDKKYKKMTLKKMKPHKSLNIYLKNDNNNLALKSIIRKLENFYKLILSKKFDNYIIIGSSLLIIYDQYNPKKTNVKIIDFNNSYNNNIKQNNSKYMNNYRIGVQNVIKEFKNLL